MNFGWVAQTNANLFSAMGNNPVKYVAPDGRYSSFLPSGGTLFNGPCPGMKYNMKEYAELNDTIADFVSGIIANSADIICTVRMLWDATHGEKYIKAAQKFYQQVTFDFVCIMSEAKVSGNFDLDKNGRYSLDECELFSNYVNSTMLLNYSDKNEFGPYKVILPTVTKKQAHLYLNTTVKISPNDEKKIKEREKER